jgi:phosphate/sulfate permease
VTIGDKTGVYIARDGALPVDFVPVGRGSIAGTLDDAGKARWLALREGLAAAVMTAPAAAVLRRG